MILLFILLCFLGFARSECVLNFSEINLIKLFRETENKTIRYTQNISDYDDTTCYFTPNENITIYVDDPNLIYDFIHDTFHDLLPENKTGNLTTQKEFEVFLKYLKFLKKRDPENLDFFCEQLLELETSSAGIYHYIDKFQNYVIGSMCNWILKKQTNNKYDFEPIVYRGENLTSSSSYLQGTNAYLYNTFKKENVTEITNYVIQKVDVVAEYMEIFQKWGSENLESILTYTGIGKTSHFSYYWSFGYETAKAAWQDPKGFYNKFYDDPKNYFERIKEKHNRTRKSGKKRIDFKQIYNIFKTKTSHGFNKIDGHVRSVTFPSYFGERYEEINNDVEFDYFNGTCYPQISEPGGGYESLKIFDLFAIHRIWENFNWRISSFTPEIKNSTSVFHWYLPRDWIAWGITYVDRWRRSPWLSWVLRSVAKEQDIENCKPGWPLYRDPQFDCPITWFAALPFYFSLAEKEIIVSGGSFTVCNPWDGILQSLQGWIKYINAFVGPYTNFPLLVPFSGFLICNVGVVKNQFKWAYFDVDGDIPCYYQPEDIPPFAEACLFLKLLIFWLLVAAFVFILLLIIITIVQCYLSYNRRYALLNRIAAIEKRVFKKNRLFFPEDEKEEEDDDDGEGNIQTLLPFIHVKPLQSFVREKVETPTYVRPPPSYVSENVQMPVKMEPLYEKIFLKKHYKESACFSDKV